MSGKRRRHGDAESPNISDHFSPSNSVTRSSSLPKKMTSQNLETAVKTAELTKSKRDQSGRRKQARDKELEEINEQQQYIAQLKENDGTQTRQSKLDYLAEIANAESALSDLLSAREKKLIANKTLDRTRKRQKREDKKNTVLQAAKANEKQLCDVLKHLKNIIGKGNEDKIVPYLTFNMDNAAEALLVPLPIEAALAVSLQNYGFQQGLLQVAWKPGAPNECHILLGTSLISTPTDFPQSPGLVPTTLSPVTNYTVDDDGGSTLILPSLTPEEAKSCAASIWRFFKEVENYRICQGVGKMAAEALAFELPMPGCNFLGSLFVVSNQCPVLLKIGDAPSGHCRKCILENAKLKTKIQQRKDASMYPDSGFRSGDRVKAEQVHSTVYYTPRSRDIVFNNVLSALRQHKKDYASVIKDQAKLRANNHSLSKMVAMLVGDKRRLTVSESQRGSLVEFLAELSPQEILQYLHEWMADQPLLQGTTLKRADVAFQTIMVDCQAHLAEIEALKEKTAIEEAEAEKDSTSNGGSPTGTATHPNNINGTPPLQQSKSMADRLKEEQARNAAVPASQRRFSPETLQFFQTLHAKSAGGYRFLRQTLGDFLYLPSTATISKHKQNLYATDGIDHAYMATCRKQKDEFQKSWETKEMTKNPTSPRPFPETFVMLMDETKLTGAVQWQKDIGVVGFSTMDGSKDLESLFNPSWQVADRQLESQYVLQFMLRCPIDRFDVLFAHYFSAAPLTAARLVPIWQEVIEAAYLYGFPVHSTVLDGASTNMLMVTTWCGLPPGRIHPIASDDNAATMFKIEFSTPVPGNSKHRCFFNICNPHQCKSMVAVLHASKNGGTRTLTRQENVYLSWDTLEQLWAREELRGEFRSVPALKRQYIFKDIWMRLNVPSAVAVMKKNLIAELLTHVESLQQNIVDGNIQFLAGNPAELAKWQVDKSRLNAEIQSVRATSQYLQTLADIFDNVLMSQEKYDLNDCNCKLPTILDDAILYFFEWQKELHDYRRANNNAPVLKDVLKCYPSEQTFDNLRLMYYGFKGYTEFFFSTFPGFFLIPQRICTNSPLESIFGCLKYMRGSAPLTGSNYGNFLTSLKWVKMWKRTQAQVHVGEVPGGVHLPVGSG